MFVNEKKINLFVLLDKYKISLFLKLKHFFLGCACMSTVYVYTVYHECVLHVYVLYRSHTCVSVWVGVHLNFAFCFGSLFVIQKSFISISTKDDTLSFNKLFIFPYLFLF